MPDIRSLISHFIGDEKGSVLVEMTIITPMLLALSAGVFEFGNLIHQKLLIEVGLRDAARYYSRCNSAIIADCTANAKNMAVFGQPSSGTARVATWATSHVSISTINTPITVDAFGNQNYRSNSNNVVTVRVTASFPYSATSLLAYLGFGAFTITGSHEERAVGW